MLPKLTTRTVFIVLLFASLVFAVFAVFARFGYDWFVWKLIFIPVALLVLARVLWTVVFTRRGGGSKRKRGGSKRKADSTKELRDLRKVLDSLKLEKLEKEETLYQIQSNVNALKFRRSNVGEALDQRNSELNRIVGNISVKNIQLERLESERSSTSKELLDLQKVLDSLKLEKLEKEETLSQIQSDIDPLEFKKANLGVEVDQRNSELNRIVGDIFVRNVQKDLDNSAYSGLLANVSDRDLNVREMVRAVVEDGALRISFKFEPEIRDKMLIIPLPDGTVEFITREVTSGEDFSKGIEEIIRSLLEGVISRSSKSRLINHDFDSFEETKKNLAGYYERNESPAPGIAFLLMTVANQYRNSLGIYGSELLYEHYENNQSQEIWTLLSDKLAQSSDALVDRINTVFNLIAQQPIYLDGLEEGSLKTKILSKIKAERLVSEISNIVSHQNLDDLLDEFSNDLSGTIAREQRKLESLQNRVRREYWEYFIRRVNSMMSDNPGDEYNALADVILARVVYEYFDRGENTFK